MGDRRLAKAAGLVIFVVGVTVIRREDVSERKRQEDKRQENKTSKHQEIKRSRDQETKRLRDQDTKKSRNPEITESSVIPKTLQPFAGLWALLYQGLQGVGVGTST